MAATRLRAGRGESFYPQLAEFIAFSPETTRILTTFRADASSSADLGRAILCRLLDLQDAHELRTNLDVAAAGFLKEIKTDALDAERRKLEDSIQLLRPMPDMQRAVTALEQKLRSMKERPPYSSGLFGAAEKFVADSGVLSQLGSHQRAAEAALIRDEFTELSQSLDHGDGDPTEHLLAIDRQAALQSLYGVRELRHIQDVDTVVAAVGFSRQSSWPHTKQNGDAVRLLPFTDEVDPSLIGKVPIYAAPIRTEAIFLRLDPCRVLRWAIETLGWSRPENSAVLSDPRRAHALILRTAPALASAPMEIRRLAAEHPQSPGHRSAAHVLGLLHTQVHCLLRVARTSSGYDMTSLTERILPADLAALVLVGSRKNFTMGGLRTLYKFNQQTWFDQAATASLRCILDPQCSQQRGASCNACLQLPLGCETFNHGISRSYLIGGEVIDVNGEHLRVEKGFWT